MNQGIYSLSATMVNQLNRVDVLSNNIANADTTAFKQDNVTEGSFNYYLKRIEQNKNSQNIDANTNKTNNITNTIPKIDGSYITKNIGAIVQTGNRLDFSLKQSDTFFRIQDNNKNILLTKSGDFKNLNGILTTSEGHKVLNNDNEAILIADGFEDQISLVKTSFENLDKRGNNNYIINDDKKVEDILFNENHIMQGAIEKSNVNMISSMVSLIDSQRRLEQAQKAMNGIDELNGKLISQLGNK